MDVGIKTANDQFQTVTTAQRTALSPTVGQCVWDSDLRQLMVYMNASGGNAWQPIGNAIVCTSTTRPSTPFEGQVIRETDTNKEYTYSGSAWVQTNSWGTTAGVTGVNNLIVPPACVAGASATLNVANASWTAVTFTTERFDTDSMHDTSTNTSRFTITTPGIYQISAYVSWSGAVGGSQRDLAIRLNGTSYVAYARGVVAGGGITNISLAYDLSNGDYVEIAAYQDSTVTMTVSADRVASVCWIGRTS
jgi:hypothetical protein